MSIDWITVSAQAINFFVLVWLLKRFLYGPVIEAMERREQRIAERLGEAAAREQAAAAEGRQLREARETVERSRADILAETEADAEREKKRLIHLARAEVSEHRENWQRQVDLEKDEFLGNLRHQAAQAIQAIARRALGDLANSELEATIVDTFLDRIRHMDAATQRTLRASSEALRIASAFELDAPVRSRLTRAVHEHLGESIEVDYVRSAELICGIELSRGGQRLSWNLADYLAELDTRIENAFNPAEASARGS